MYNIKLQNKFDLTFKNKYKILLSIMWYFWGDILTPEHYTK